MGVRVPPGPLQDVLLERRTAMLKFFGPRFHNGPLARDLRLTGLLKEENFSIKEPQTWTPGPMYTPTSGSDGIVRVLAMREERLPPAHAH